MNTLDIDTLDTNKPKAFVTFPYPYMNGRLHIGHGFTLMKADVIAKYKQMIGYNVLFPFGFHCTGMPIKASSDNLKEELENGKEGKQYYNMIKMGIPKDQISRFTDPTYFFEYFPIKAITDLKQMELSVDWSRSFITTNSNPYYSSFVQWQFKTLKDKGLIYFGNRYVIWSVKNNQACSDHARSSGEGVKPKKYGLVFMKLAGDSGGDSDNESDNNYIAIMTSSIKPEITLDHIGIHPDKEYVITKTKDGKNVIMSDWCYMNCYHQNIVNNDNNNNNNKHIKGSKLVGRKTNVFDIIGNTNIRDKGSGIVFKTGDNNKSIKVDIITYYEPESDVISRSGDRCVVSYTDGWFIKYSDEKWKSQTKKAINEYMVTTVSAVKDSLINTIEQFEDKTFSRSKETTLGTEIPWDPQYFIDSLSDSTIYMMYYTVCHYFHTDLTGNDTNPNYKILASDLTNDVWDYIFVGGSVPTSKIPIKTLDMMKTEFHYWYPLDMRVSAKDLISNHLSFSLMHHVAILGSEWIPRNFLINGYITINHDKMSKSVGNFITLSDSLKMYGVDGTRFALADAGDDMSDGMFDPNTAISIQIKLDQKLEWIKSVTKSDTIQTTAIQTTAIQTTRTGKFKLIDEIFNEQINQYVFNTTNAYESCQLKKVCHWDFN